MPIDEVAVTVPSGSCAFLVGGPDSQAPLLTPERLDEQQRLIARAARELVDGAVRPRLKQIEAMDFDLTRTLLREAGDLGLLGIDVPECFGGLGLDLVTSTLVAEEMGRAGSFNNSFSAHTGIASWPLIYFGTAEQKQRFLPGLSDGTVTGAYALTESGSGSDALAARTTAVLSTDGAEWILNGSKQFITNSGFADLFTLYAKVDGEKFSAFLIERDTPGFSMGAEEHKMGLKGSSTRTLQLENARIPRANLLGEVGRGHIIAFTILNLGRLKLAASAVGTCKHALQIATAYACERRQFGRPIVEFGLVRDKLAEMAMWTYAAESIMLRTAGLVSYAVDTLDTSVDCGATAAQVLSEHAVECAINKVLATEALDLVADEAVQIHGGNGYMDDYEVSHIYRDARINRIFEGTNEINRLLVVNRILRHIQGGSLAAPDSWGPVRGSRAPAPWADMLRWAVGEAFEVALERYADGLAEQQEVAVRLADLASDVFTVESLILRAESAPDDDRAIHQDLADLWSARALRRAERSCAELASFLDDDRVGPSLQANLSRPAMNPIATRRRVADAVVKAGGYPLSR
jgi:alkylation response protein AidB-like acyl-CoA dehydrogenase